METSHAMYSPDAQKALTSETRGQNSWVNFGPHGEQNRKDPTNTIYADQKATILPDWAMKQGPESVYSKLNKSERPYPSHLPKFKRGDRVKLSHGVINKETGKYIIHDKVHIVHGVAKQGQHAHWVVPEGESSNKGFYHKTDRMHHADEVKKYENDLMKMGMRGDWKKEGYKLKIKHNVNYYGISSIHITAHHPTKGLVGESYFREKDTHLSPMETEIHPEHQRKGLATSMYNLASRTYGKEVISNPTDRSADAEKFWANRIDKSDHLQINISLPDEELDLIKAEDYKPTSVGEIHPTKPLVGAMHPETGLAWHHNPELAAKNDAIINDPEMRQRLLSKMPTATHKAGMEAIMNMVAKSPNRHFIPSRDGGKERMRARHIKSLILNPDSAKINLGSNGIMSISLPRHGTYGGETTWNYNIKPKKVVKSEQSGLGENEQGGDFEIDERVRSRRDLRRHGRNNRAIKKAQHRAGIGGSGDRNTRNRVSGKHLQKLDFLKKSDLSTKIKTGIAGMAIAASPISPSSSSNQMGKTPVAQTAQQHLAKPTLKTNNEKERILGAISDVESSNGKNIQHARLPQNSIHRGERAYGLFGLTPVVIRETIKKNPKLFSGHEDAAKMRGSDIHNYMDKHPELEHKIASTHYDRLAKVFGHSPAKIGHAWLSGIMGTKKALKEKQDIDSHWHVQKIKSAYENRKKKGIK